MWWDSLGRPRQIWTCIKVIWENQKMSSGVIRLGQFRFRVSLTGDSEDKRRVWKNREKKLPFSKRAKNKRILGRSRYDTPSSWCQFSMVPGCHPIDYLPGGSFSHPCRADAADIVPTSWGCWEINNGQLGIPQTKGGLSFAGDIIGY